MKATRVIIIIVFFLSIGGLILIKRSDKNNDDIFELPDKYEVVSVNAKKNIVNDPFAPVPKVVTFFKTEAVFELRRWIPYIENYENISFIFYNTEKSSKKLIENLKKMNFPLPIYITEDKQNPNSNYLLICYLLDEQNRLVCVSNPSLPDFNKQLDALTR